MSDLLSALENATNRDKISCLIENGISTIPIQNFADDQITLLEEKAYEWNKKQSDNHMFIHAKTEEMCRGRMFSLLLLSMLCLPVVGMIESAMKKEDQSEA